MGRFGKVQQISASGGGVPFFPRETATHVVLHRESGFDESDAGKGAYWGVNVVVLDTDGEEVKVGQLRRQQYMHSNNAQHSTAIAKSIVLAFLGITEAEFDELPADEAQNYMESFYPDEDSDKFVSTEEPLLAILRTTETFSKEKKHPITGHSWSPAPDSYYDEYADAIEAALFEAKELAGKSK